jgi:hypothetical protein
MSDLHPTARALLEAGRRGEPRLSDDVRARVHRSVLRRAGAFGTAVATTTSATVVAKAGALAGTAAGALVSIGLLGGVAGVTFFAVKTPSVHPALPANRESMAAAQAPVATRELPQRGRDSLGVAPGGPLRPRPEDTSHAVPPPPARAPLQSPVLATPHPAALPARPLHPLADGAPTSSPASALPNEGTVGGAGPAGAALDGPSTNPAPATPPEADALRHELAVLHEAHASLRAGRPDQALALLQPHAPLDRGPLAEEAEIVRITALCQAGRDRDARAAADLFLARWPSSPVSARLRLGCASLSAGTAPVTTERSTGQR